MESDQPPEPVRGPQADPVPQAHRDPQADPVPQAHRDPQAAPGPQADPAGGANRAPAFQILRSRSDRKLGGVAGGLAAAADLDPTLVRLAVLLGCLTGWGILGYLIAWVVIPEEDPARGRYLLVAPERTGRHLRIGLTVIAVIGVLQMVGAVLGIVSSALIGLGLFPARIFGLSHRGFVPGEALFGLFLVVGGSLVLFRRHLPWLPAADAGGAPGAGSAATAAASSWGSTAPATPDPHVPADPTGEQGRATAPGAGAPPPPPPPAPGFGARASAAAQAARTNAPLLLVRATGWLVVLWFAAAAVVAGLFWATGALHVARPVIPIVAGVAALAVLGYTLIRVRRVAVVIGAIALLLVPAGLAAALTRIDGQAGRRSVTPLVPADLERTYRHAAGTLDLDLSRLALPAGETTLALSMGAGRIDVTVPWDTDVVARASVGAGVYDLFGNRQSGLNLTGRTHSPGRPEAPVLVITGRAGAGGIVVRRGSEPITHEALRSGQPVPVMCVGSSNGALRCGPMDGVTPTPALGCVVSESGSALCRPAGEAEPAVGFADDPGTRRCQVPAGGGESACTPPIPTPPGSAAGDAFTCTIPDGGGEAVCRPAEPSPGASATTGPQGPDAGPGEYRCTIPEGGGPATCEPA